MPVSDHDRRGGAPEKASVSHSNVDNLLSNFHKKSDSMDKNSILHKKGSSNVKGNTTANNNNKFYLNTNYKMFHFKSNSKHLDSGSKRSPSFSNSNLPTDLPTNKVRIL